jgi:hypothetical protein
MCCRQKPATRLARRLCSHELVEAHHRPDTLLRLDKAVSIGRRNTSANLSLGGTRHETWTSLGDMPAAMKQPWCRPKASETFLGIGCAVGPQQATIHRVPQATGIAPARRRRSPRVLSFGEREEISRGLGASKSFRAMAQNGQTARSRWQNCTFAPVRAVTRFESL